MKFARHLFGIFGLSTFHLHNNPLIGSTSLSKIIPEVKPARVLAQVQQKQQETKRIEFKIISFEKDDPLPRPIRKKTVTMDGLNILNP